MTETIEQSLNGGYGGLYGEVVTEDIYRLKQLRFVPDIIFDFGANVGIFTRYARELFPEALIVAVEPDKGNIDWFRRHTSMEGVVLLEKAIGHGKVFRHKQYINGAHESYVNAGPGYPFGKSEFSDYEETEVSSVMPHEIINFYLDKCPSCKSVLKMDIEGNENVVFNNLNSIRAMKKIDYVSIELHRISLVPQQQDDVNSLTAFATQAFSMTHACSFDVKDTMFYAIKNQ